MESISDENVKFVHDIIERKLPCLQDGKPVACLDHEMSLLDEDGDIHIVTFPKTGTVVFKPLYKYMLILITF